MLCSSLLCQSNIPFINTLFQSNELNTCISSSSSAHASQERGLPDAGEGRPHWRNLSEHQRGVLLGPGPPVATQLHLQVQSDRRGGPEETVSPRVPQRLAAGGCAEKVLDFKYQ